MLVIVCPDVELFAPSLRGDRSEAGTKGEQHDERSEIGMHGNGLSLRIPSDSVCWSL